MELRLNPSDGVPVYRQIVNQVKYLIASGRLVSGQELTPIRALAEQLVIGPNTVVHAYAELVRDGVVVSLADVVTHSARPVSGEINDGSRIKGQLLSWR